ncbi:MAG: S24/S26 family peptidase [Nitrospirota bacterium]|nr:S24/S26 family peptidase [Nitrospirota bacterium]MDP2384504.1 S24/S26 family peptidase [Nitrospirota bacterium]MDP3596140.1 S24/S26 family peptidase [Nitrospirota bacterium]
MIHLLPTHTVDGRFSLQDVPDALHWPLLNSLVVPRIMSSSMTPTIQADDRLELSPPSPLTVGAIVVFRTENMFICHRIAAMDAQGILTTKGDAANGPGEAVPSASVIGVVRGVMRKGRYIAVGECPDKSFTSTESPSSRNRVRAAVVRSAIRITCIGATYPLIQNMLLRLLRKTAMVDAFAPAPLRSLPSHVRIGSFRLQAFPDFNASRKEPQPTHYVLRLGPWRLAQYEPATESLLLRQSLQDAGLEPFVRRCISPLQIDREYGTNPL